MQAIRSALGQSSNPTAYEKPILQAYDKAEVKLKAALLPAFARLQSETALEKAMAALRSDRQALRDAAIEALGGWASIEAGQALLKAAKNASKQTDQTAALRSLAMLTRNATQAGAAERGALLKAALELKASPAADKALLSAVGTVHSGQAMHLAAKQLDRDAVRNEAAIAALQIAEQTHWAPHGAEAIARKIAGLDVNDSIKKRAEKVAKAQAETKFTAIAEGVLQDASGKAGALTGTYYNGKSFGQKQFTRRDPAVAFNWSKGSASEKLGSDHYSVRWTGKLNVPASGQYTFALRHDDGMRLWVNGQQVINGWNAGAARVSTGSVTLSEGETVPIKVEYYESSGYAVAQMGWQPPKKAFGQAGESGGKLSVLIVDGQNNHAWKKTSPVMKRMYQNSPRFGPVDVATSPPNDTKGFTPNFSDYDLVALNYNGKPWPKQTEQAFERYVKNGGAVMVMHAADNSFPEWKAYNRMIGLGGWGGRNQSDGPYVYYKDGKLVRDNSKGGSGTHGAQWAFPVKTRKPNHPIMDGLSGVWRHSEDELYARLRGPAKEMTVLATAKSRKTNRHEPILMTIDYHDGRVFHTVLGHDVKSMRCAGFQHTLLRGSEWAATGEVTLEKPDDFPGPDDVVLR